MSTPRTARDSNADVIEASDAAVDEYALLQEKISALVTAHRLGLVDERATDAQTGRQIWAFEAALNEVMRLIERHRARLKEDNPASLFEMKAIEAESKDYFDTATTSYRLDLYDSALKLYRKVIKIKKLAPDVGEKERRRLKSIVRVVIAGFDFLHTNGEFGVAITYAKRLLAFVNNSGLATEDDPAYSEKAVIYYFLGRTHRQRGIDDDYRLAIDYFYQCHDYFFAEARRGGIEDVDVIYARTRAAVSLAFGAGFLYFNAQSDLALAKGMIAQARNAFLRDSGEIRCKYHYSYVELLYASILRAEAGELLLIQGGDAERDAAKDKLDRALEILEDCQKWLRSKPNYYNHLLYNKALVHLFRGPQEYAAAGACIDELVVKCQNSPRWLANALVMRSRLARRLGHADAALEDALRAFNLAGSHLHARIEALFASGEAQLDRGNASAARADFEKAYLHCRGANKKQEVMALILLAEVALAQQRPQLALERFNQAQALIGSISHGFILNRFRRLESQLTSGQADFVIYSSVEDLDYEKHERALRCWLLDMALRKDRSLTRAADRLNVSKKTVYHWRDIYKIKT